MCGVRLSSKGRHQQRIKYIIENESNEPRGRIAKYICIRSRQSGKRIFTIRSTGKGLADSHRGGRPTVFGIIHHAPLYTITALSEAYRRQGEIDKAVEAV